MSAPAEDRTRTKTNKHMTNSTTTPRSQRDSAPVIHFPTKEEKQALLDGFFAEQRKINQEGRAAVEAAIPAMARLAEVLQGRSGQPYKLRALLFSLYNGKPARLVEIVGLDREIRADLCAVLLAFGFEETRFVDGVPQPGVTFFYDELRAAIVNAGQWKWFLEESQVEEEA